MPLRAPFAYLYVSASVIGNTSAGDSLRYPRVVSDCFAAAVPPRLKGATACLEKGEEKKEKEEEETV